MLNKDLSAYMVDTHNHIINEQEYPLLVSSIRSFCERKTAVNDLKEDNFLINVYQATLKNEQELFNKFYKDYLCFIKEFESNKSIDSKDIVNEAKILAEFRKMSFMYRNLQNNSNIQNTFIFLPSVKTYDLWVYMFIEFLLFNYLKQDDNIRLESKRMVNIHYGIGVHPMYADSFNADIYDFYDRCLDKEMQKSLSRELDDLNNINYLYKINFIGEIGLDKRFLADISLEQQEQCLRYQLKLAQKYVKPVLIHNVRMHADMIRILKDFYPKSCKITRNTVKQNSSQTISNSGNDINKVNKIFYNFDRLDKTERFKGIIHGFSGSVEIALMYIELGFLIGIGSNYWQNSNNKCKKLISAIGLRNIVLETDYPYMEQDFYKSKELASEIALYMKCSTDELLDIVNSNLGIIVSSSI